MEMYLVQVETTKKAVAAKNAEIAQLQENSRNRPAAKKADNPAVVKLQQDIQTRRHELQTTLSAVQQKEAEFERARLHEEDVQRNIDLHRMEDSEDDERIDEIRRRNRELQGKLRKLQKDLFVKEQETRRGEARLKEVEERGRRLKQVEEESLRTLQMMGYSVRDLDQIQQMVETKEADLVTIEEIADMMDDAINLMDSAVETAKLEEEVVTHSSDASEAALNANQQFEHSPQLRLWRASGMAACAVYKAMILGRQRGKSYVEDAQFRQAHEDIADRLRESEVVKEKLQARLLQLEQREEAQRDDLARSVTLRDSKRHEEDNLRATIEGPEQDEVPQLQKRVPEVDATRRLVSSQLRDLESEWERVDAQARKKYETVEQAIEDHLQVLRWEKAEAKAVAERVAAIKQRELQVVEKRLALEQQTLDAQSTIEGMPEELTKFL